MRTLTLLLMVFILLAGTASPSAQGQYLWWDQAPPTDPNADPFADPPNFDEGFWAAYCGDREDICNLMYDTTVGAVEAWVDQQIWDFRCGAFYFMFGPEDCSSGIPW
jgi:hypothetical protein